MKASPRVLLLRKSLLAGARQAEGIAVVIDVLRAFTAAAFMMHLGAQKIVLLADAEEVLRLKREEGCLAVGEVDGRPLPGFDLGNSPARILACGRDLFAGRVVAHRTTAGTVGAVVAARRSQMVILGSYVTAAAIARYIQGLSPPPEVVSLVAMGDSGLRVTPDDEACADYIEHLLVDRAYDHVAALQKVVEHECAQMFLRGDQAYLPAADAVYCLQRDLFGFILGATLENDQLIARRIDVPQERAT